MNKDNEKPLKLLGRVMAKVMFEDLYYISEERGKLRSQGSNYLMERVTWA